MKRERLHEQTTFVGVFHRSSQTAGTPRVVALASNSWAFVLGLIGLQAERDIIKRSYYESYWLLSPRGPVELKPPCPAKGLQPNSDEQRDQKEAKGKKVEKVCWITSGF